MVDAHCADALVCTSKCDKITPSMLMASMRLNVPVVIVSGGPTESGKVRAAGRDVKIDGVTTLVAAGNPDVPAAEVAELERSPGPAFWSSPSFARRAHDDTIPGLENRLFGRAQLRAVAPTIQGDRRPLKADTRRRHLFARH